MFGFPCMVRNVLQKPGAQCPDVQRTRGLKGDKQVQHQFPKKVKVLPLAEEMQSKRPLTGCLARA